MGKLLLIALTAALAFSIVPTSQKQEEAKILFVGDMNFDRYIRKVVGRNGGDYIFSCLEDYLKSPDLVVGNLEGPITDNPSVSLGSEVGSPSNFVFTFPPSTAGLLYSHNIRLVNLGNNHISNFENIGIASTRTHLDKSKVKYFGGIAGDEPTYRTKLGETEISFVSYNQFGGDSSKKVAEKISKESAEGRLVIVYTHWGDEYVPANDFQKKTAKLFADSGAKAIIGSHPHVIQEHEMIGDTLVYYSLGNFIFDQYWNTEVRTGLMLELTIKKGKIETSEHTVNLERDGRTCLVKQ